MAEVGQRLGNGVYRLSALKTSQSRAVCPGESPGCHITNHASVSGRVTEKSVQCGRAVQSASESREKLLRSQKVSTVKESGSQVLESAAASGFIAFLENMGSLRAHKAALFLQKKLLPCRRTLWTTAAVSIHSDAFRSPQQRRALCTFTFTLADPGSDRLGCGHGLRCLNLRPDTLKPNFTAARSYSWSSEDTPLLHRSRTAYYDILKVSLNATQSQIKTAYYKQSFIYHPDKNPGSKEATQRFSDISEAYTVLGNISLRRKYDRGILSRADIQNAGRPSSKEASSRSTGSPQKSQQRARQFSQPGGRPIFDFDAFYQAHYGEQLQREKDLRARKQRMEEELKKHHSRWRQKKMMELAVVMLLAMAGLIIINVNGP
ncbi:protein JBTS17 [Sarotherodon galilaeus]